MAKLLLVFPLCYFLYIIKNPQPINFISNAILYYLLVIYILLRIHNCLHVFASFYLLFKYQILILI